MRKVAVFSLKIESALCAEFMSEARALDRSASSIVRDFMREFVAERQKERLAAEIASGKAPQVSPSTAQPSSTEAV